MASIFQATFYQAEINKQRSGSAPNGINETEIANRIVGGIERGQVHFVRSLLDMAEASQSVARSLQQTVRIIAEVNAQLRGGVGGSPIIRSGGGAMGGLPLPVGPGLAIGAIVAAVSTAMRSGTTIANFANHSELTDAQKIRGISENLPVIGSTIRQIRLFGEAVTGVTDKMRVLGIQIQESAAVRSAMFQAQAQRTTWVLSQESASNRYNGLVGATPESVRSFDRTTLAGERQFQEQQSIQSYRDEAAAARRRATAAEHDVMNVQYRLDINRQNADNLRRRRSQFMANNKTALEDKDPSAPRNVHGEAVQGLHEIERAQVDNDRERLTLIQRLRDASVSAAQAEAAARRANLGIMQAELATMQAREQRITANASRLGGLNPMQRQMGLAAARLVRDRGIGNVTPEVLSAASQVAPEWMQLQQQQFGERTAEAAALRREGFFGNDTQSIQQIRAEVANAQTNVRVQMILDEQQLSRQIMESFRDNYAEFARLVIREAVVTVREEMRRDRQIGQATAN